MAIRAFVLILFSLGAGLAQTPVVVDGGVLNAASFGKTVTPGSLVAIFGDNLAGQLQQNDTVPLSTMLADVTVTFNDITAGLEFVAPGVPNVSRAQINAQLPWNVLPDGVVQGTVNVVVTRNGVSSAPQQVTVTEFSPAVFTFSGTGAGQANAFNFTDGSIPAPPGTFTDRGFPVRPAKIGDVLIVYANGLGAVDSPIANGADSSDKQRNTKTMPVVLIGGKSASVLFSGLAPQFPGVNQLNIQVPAGVAPGNNVPLQIQMGSMTSTDQVTIAVQ